MDDGKRLSDLGKSDHDLLVEIAYGFRSLRDDVADLKLWRQRHETESALREAHVAALITDGTASSTDIDELQSWRAEMRGAWSGVKIGLALLGGLSALSIILEAMRLVGVIR